jgi:hypothetical protein
VHFVLQGH